MECNMVFTRHGSASGTICCCPSCKEPFPVWPEHSHHCINGCNNVLYRMTIRWTRENGYQENDSPAQHVWLTLFSIPREFDKYAVRRPIMMAG